MANTRPSRDALGKFGECGVILVEAKANLNEFASDPSGAKGKSLELIERSCKEVQAALGVSEGHSWTGTYYQYANRLAHWHFLRENGMDARLVFLYFVNDPHTKGPTSEASWHEAIRKAHTALGLPASLPPTVHEVFVDVARLLDA